MSSGKRWAQQDDDSARLPEGMRRVGYDADSRRYTFLDRKGTLYQSDPGNEFGHLTPMGGHAERAEMQRPTMFEGNAPTKKETDETSTGTKPLTFQDFVPAELITSPKYSPDEGPPPSKKSPSSRNSQERKKEKRRGHSRHMSATSASSSSSSGKRHIEFTEEPTSLGDTSPKERFREAVKASGIPKMQGVVQSLRRSVTSVTKKGFGGGRKRRERPQSEIKDSKAAAEYVQLTDS